MRARLPLVSALLIAVGLSGCAVPAAETGCVEPVSTPAAFHAVYPPLVDGWEAIPLLESNGWILDDGEPAEGTLARATLSLPDAPPLHAVVADVRDASGAVVGTSLRVEAPASRVATDEAAALLLRPHVSVLEAAFAGRVGAPLEARGYFGGEAC